MIFFLFPVFIFSFLTSPSESLAYTKITYPNTPVYNFIYDYIDIPHIKDKPKDFLEQKQAKFDIIDLDYSWRTEQHFLTYRQPAIPELKGSIGTLYQSGIHYDSYQKRLNTSYALLVDIHNELKDALDLACKICVSKERIPLITCPKKCLAPIS